EGGSGRIPHEALRRPGAAAHHPAGAGAGPPGSRAAGGGQELHGRYRSLTVREREVMAYLVPDCSTSRLGSGTSCCHDSRARHDRGRPSAGASAAKGRINALNRRHGLRRYAYRGRMPDVTFGQAWLDRQLPAHHGPGWTMITTAQSPALISAPEVTKS